jgi:hypothetical protein
MKIGLNLPHACIYVATLDIKLHGHNMDTIGYHKHIAWYHMPNILEQCLKVGFAFPRIKGNE